MYQVLTPLEAQFIQQDREHLEVVVLLVAHHVDHLIDGEILEAQLGCTDVLRHIYAGTIGTEQQLLIQALLGQVGPYRTVFSAIEETLLQTFFHLLLTFQIGVAFVIYLVEAYAQCLVCLIEAGIYPFVHLLPQATNLRVVLLPLHQHLMCFLNKGCFLLGLLLVHALSHEFLHLLAVVLVKGHIVITYQMVTLLATCLRSLTVTILKPCQHALADVNTTVVNDIGLHYLVTIGLHYVGKRPTQQVVTYMTQVKGLIGIRT